MANLLLVAHCPSPNTEALRDAFLRGVAAGGEDAVTSRALAPLEADAGDVEWADLVAIGTTENFGYMAGRIKDFLERIYYPCLERTEGLPWSLYVRAGTEGTGTIASVERIVTGLRWRAVQAPELFRGNFEDGFLERCETLGAGLAAGLAAGIF